MARSATPLGALLLSLLVALFLDSVPLPGQAVHFRPDWLAMVLIYWCLAWPQRVGVFFGWSVGLLVDVMHGSLLGQNALAMGVICYFTHILHLRMRMFPLWQQAAIVIFLVFLHLGISAWVRGMTGHFPVTTWYWMPALVSGLIWPVVFIVLRDLRRKGV